MTIFDFMSDIFHVSYLLNFDQSTIRGTLCVSFFVKCFFFQIVRKSMCFYIDEYV